MNIWQRLCLNLVAILEIGCTTIQPQNCDSIKQLRQCTSCTVTGWLEMSSDGHGFIAKLVLENGECVNVSLPTAEARNLLGKPPRKVKVHGDVLPYPVPSGADGLVLGYRVKGRPVGQGLCGDRFLFVQ